MPLDILVVDKEGNAKTYYVPLRMMRGEKDNPYPNLERKTEEDWPWAYPNYELVLDIAKENLAGINIDPSDLMADVDRENNLWQAAE